MAKDYISIALVPDEVHFVTHTPETQAMYEQMSQLHWCECGKQAEQLFRNDGECSCPVRKHHYHCGECLGLTQIG